ncbi:MAG: hypothetical protein JXR51_01060 [Bacteroidales bacterium]|nr:hypothetical protein [Bacteroidales bacterium]MBN2755732.1 hypothetical protein [Bacteroidales bacterium]
MFNLVKYVIVFFILIFFEINIISQKNGNVYFKIQIAASKVPLSENKLNEICKANDILNVEFENEWYKYSIHKKFFLYEDAAEYKNSLNVKGAFIIAYKNEQKVDIKEVVDLGNLKPELVNKIVYRLELAVSVKKADAKTMEMIKSGGMPIITEKQNAWYSYTIGDFISEEEAIKFKEDKQLFDAKVVKYKNGKPLK